MKQLLRALLTLCIASSALDARAAGDDPANPAPADTPSETAEDEAARRFQRGFDFYEQREFELALIEFQRAYELVPRYPVLYNIGQVQIQLGRYAGARVALEQYLTEGAAELDAERVAAVRADLVMLAARTAFLAVTVSVPGAEVFIDDRSVGVAPLPAPVLVDAGQHVVLARLEGYKPKSTQLTLAGGDEASATLELTPEHVTPQPVREVVIERPPAPPVAPVAEESPDRKWIGWATTGALAASALATGLAGATAASDLRELRESADATRGELDRTQARARSLLVTSDVLSAAALTTGGVTLFITLRKRGEGAERGSALGAPAPTLRVGPGTVAFGCRF